MCFSAARERLFMNKAVRRELASYRIIHARMFLPAAADKLAWIVTAVLQNGGEAVNKAAGFLCGWVRGWLSR